MGRGPHIPAGPSPVPPLPFPCFVALEKSLSSPEPLLTLLVRGVGRLVPCPPPQPAFLWLTRLWPHLLFCDTPTSACLRAFATDASWNILPRAPSSHPEPLLLLPPQRGLRDHPSQNTGTPSLCISVALDVLVPLDCTPSFNLLFPLCLALS